MPTTPAASAARAGMPGNPDAINASAQVNQVLGSHQATAVYGGTQILNTPVSSTGTETIFFWIDQTTVPSIPDFGLLTSDFDQPITMPAGATAIGRIEVALLPHGAAADVQISLLPDNGSGAPNVGAPIASTVVPAAWITALAAPDGLTSGGPLAVPRHNAVFAGVSRQTSWSQPAEGPNGAGQYATPVVSGDYAILLGGYDPVAASAAVSVATVQYLGDQTLSGPSPQPPLPQGAWYGQATATQAALVYAGGTNGTVFYNNVWCARWDPNTGTVGAWSAQTSLPSPLIQGGMASWGDTVYVVGGSSTLLASNATANVWYASAVNGQITQWLPGPPLPQALQALFVGVVGDWLIVAGGQTTADVTSGSTYYAPINSDGSLGGWRLGPQMPQPAYALGTGWNKATADTALLVYSGDVSGTSLSNALQTLTVSPAGLGTWQYQWFNANDFQAAAFPATAPGAWDLFAMQDVTYVASTVSPVPMVSVPLPATGLTPGATYHVLVHQIGGGINDYLQLGELSSSQQWFYAPRGSGGPWTAHAQHAVLMNIYDQTATGRLLHAWADPTAANLAVTSATYVHDSSGRLLGECAATAQITQPGEPPAYLPSVAALEYAGDGGMPTGVTQLA